MLDVCFSYATPGYESLAYLCQRFFEAVLDNISLIEPYREQERRVIKESVECSHWNGVVERFDELDIVAALSNVPSFRLMDVAVKQMNYHYNLALFPAYHPLPPEHFEARYVFKREGQVYMHIQIKAEVSSPSPLSGDILPRSSRWPAGTS